VTGAGSSLSFGLPVVGSSLSLSATSTFGLEAVVAGELAVLGYAETAVQNGRVSFAGKVEDMARCNLWLRTADRLLIRLAAWPAASFDDLFSGVKQLRWGEFLPANARVHVDARSRRSRLSSLPALQSSVKKAIVEVLKRAYHVRWIEETGPFYRVEIALEADQALLTLDSSGEGLHRRGYRHKAGEAPLRETLAAALVLLSRWTPSRILVDPCCGSGTIPIEGAMVGRKLAPGLLRSFAAEAWPSLPRRLWLEAREQARLAASMTARELKERPLRILASDVDGRALQLARDNARRAGVEEDLSFRVLPAERFASEESYGCLICNPPYGERSGERAEVQRLYAAMGRISAALPEWSLFILSAHPAFERLFGRRADRKRKLYNGNLRTYLYQYFGSLPPEP
jgi:putative N6-adenine-specific DNA methylase